MDATGIGIDILSQTPNGRQVSPQATFFSADWRLPSLQVSHRYAPCAHQLLAYRSRNLHTPYTHQRSYSNLSTFHISFLYMKGDAILWGEPRHTSFKCSIDSPSICASPSFLNTCMPSHAPVVTWVAFFSLSLSLPLSPSLARCKRQRLRLEWRCNGSLMKQGPSSRTASEHRTSSGGKPNHLGNKPPSIGLRMSGFKMNFGQPNRG